MIAMAHCRDLDPAERLLARILKQAVKDAQQSKNARLRQEAARWLWRVAPTVAERVDLPARGAEEGLLPVTGSNPSRFPSNSLALMVLRPAPKG